MAALNWDLIESSDKITVKLSGELSRNTLLPLWRQRASFLFENVLSKSVIKWNLAEVSRIDSAGLALLCDFLYRCQKLSYKEIRLIHPPAQLLTLADLVNLSDWIAGFIHDD